MASRRPLMPALCALRQAARHSCHHQQPATAAAAAKATAAAGPRTFSSIAAQPSTQRKHRTVGVVAPPLPAGAPASRWRRYYSQERQQPPPGNKIWSFEDVQKLTQEAKPNVVIVDVREPGELQSTGRIPGAVNIPVTSQPDSFHISDDDFEDRFGYARPGRDRELVFYCKAGVRGRAAAGLAREAGWSAIGEYPGSWLDWAGKGGRVER